jgi:tRNA threonylcarbamoyladenosine biosynthesis protein TsaB
MAKVNTKFYICRIEMQYLLHIDTSGDIPAIVLSCDGNLIDSFVPDSVKNHAAVVNVGVHQLLEKNGLKLADIDAFAVCGGPGSYTGLRIGLAAAKGFCYALQKPLLLDNRLDLIGYQLVGQYPDNYISYFTVLKAREREYFAAVYDKDFNTLVAPQHWFEDDLIDLFCRFENGIAAVSSLQEVPFLSGMNQFHAIENTNINFTSWSKYAYEKFTINDFVNIFSAEPFYLKQVFTHK